MTQNCGTCAYASKPVEGNRSCMRHPPVLINAIVAHNLSVSRGQLSRGDLQAATAWPLVTDKNGCGEWEPRDPPPPPHRPFRAILRERQGGGR